MEILAKLLDATGSRKLNVAATKLKVHIIKLVHKIATKFQRLYIYSGGPTIQ